ncbi:hypothetical protein NMY22_g14775 [Coprinellus aureogranulatus]|nr:hypothetical protein NMY22_g14775 [Coprinellus aureogranulatus]
MPRKQRYHRDNGGSRTRRTTRRNPLDHRHHLPASAAHTLTSPPYHHPPKSSTKRESPQRCFMADNAPISHDIRRRKPPLKPPASPTSPNGIGNGIETTEDEAHAHVQAQQQRAWPPPEHRSRAPEFYGFVAWTSTYLLFVIYLLWAFLPDAWIVWLGVTWYPNREWAILVPAWSIMAVLFTYIVYFALALRGTPPLDDLNSITDGHTLYPKARDDGLNPWIAATEPIPELYDIPLSMVNRVLYLDGPPTKSKDQPTQSPTPPS